jgi:YggT family protein
VAIVCALLTIFLVVLFARAVLSWFPIEPGSFVAQINDVLRMLTDWAALPLRRVIPPLGMIDVSYFVLVFGVLILRGAIC